MGLTYVFSDLLLPLAAGYCFRRRRLISEAACDWLIRFNIIVVGTILSILSFWVLPLRAELFFLPLFGVIFCIIPGAAARMLTAARFDNMLERGSYMEAAILSNLGTMGGLCAFLIYGEIGFAYVQMVALVQNAVVLLFCFPLGDYYYRQHLQSSGGLRPRVSWREVLIGWNQLPIAGMLLGMGLYLGGVPRPEMLTTLFNFLVHFGAWVAFFPVGYSIDFTGAKKYYRRVLDLLPIKFLVTPAIIYAVDELLFADPLLKGVLLILSAMPTAINAVITARLFKLEVDLAVAAFILTTVVYMFAVFPLQFLLLA